MPTKTLTFAAETPAGSIEIAVSEKVAATMSLAEWGERIRALDASDARRDRRVRAREVPLTDLGESLPDDGLRPVRSEMIVPVRKPSPDDDDGFDPLVCWRFWIARCHERDPDGGRWVAYEARMVRAWFEAKERKKRNMQKHIDESAVEM